MKVHIVSIFPEAFNSYFSFSIFRIAIKNDFFKPVFYKLNNFSDKKFKHVDDKAYGMHGQVLSPKPISKAIDFIFEKVWKKIPVIFLTPGWELLNQELAEKYYEKLEKEFIIICWHYEWIDQRIIEYYDVKKISIWKYVVSSWELSTMVFLDCLVRHIPWVLWNENSFLEESFSKKLNRQKEYPAYTRPKKFLWLKVPDVLISWNHKEIERWKKDNLV